MFRKPLTVKTVYFDHTFRVLKINRATTPKKASSRAFDHMQENSYGANTVQVFDGETGKLFSELVRTYNPDGTVSVNTTYKHGDPANKDVNPNHPRRAVAALLVGLDLPKETHY